MNAHERRILLDDGASTILESWGSDGPNVLGIHGITSSRKSWERTAAAMELAYTMHAYDQRGHGDSYAVEGPMSFERSVRDCRAVCDAIAGGVDTLLGHSWGGAVAILAGLELPVARVIAIDPLFHERGTDWEGGWRAELEPIFALDDEERERAVMAFYGDLPDVEIQAKLHAMRDMTIDPILGIGRDNNADRGELDLRKKIVNYPKPLLVMLADPEHSVVHPDDVAFIREHGGPNVTVRVFEGEGHSLLRTAFEEYMRALNAFVAAPPR